MARRSEVTDLLVDKYGVDRARIRDDATMQELGLDSLSVAELLFDLEDHFGIEIDAEDTGFTTLGEALELLGRYVDFDVDGG